jgi:hypothetical protein
MTGYWFAVALCIFVAVLVFSLLRTQRIREKYAAIWIVLALAVVLLGVFPNLAAAASRLVGVLTPINLVFAIAAAVLFAVCVQLSSELSRSEEHLRKLAERMALLELEVRSLREAEGEPHTEDEESDSVA